MRKSRLIIAGLATTLTLISGCSSSDADYAAKIDNVAVIVLDDFNVSPKQRPKDSTSNCAYVGTPSSDVGSTGAPGSLIGIHGDVVYKTVAADLDNLLGARENDSPSAYGLTAINGLQVKANKWTVIAKPQPTGAAVTHRVTLVGLDTQDFNTATIATELGKLLDRIRENGNTKFTRIVLNMSFVLAPCDIARWLADLLTMDDTQLRQHYLDLLSNDPTLVSFHDKLASLLMAGNPSADDLAAFWQNLFAQSPWAQGLAVNVFYRPLGGGRLEQLLKGELKDGTGADRAAKRIFDQINNPEDPLRKLTKSPGKGVEFIPVGAAGNGSLPSQATQGAGYPLTFPLAPALWDEVTSASASDDDHQQPKAGYSNSGEMALSGVAATTLPDASGNQVKPQGTSFSAAHLSVQEALYLLTGGTTGQCRSGVSPALGYANPSNPVWNNEPMKNANTYCATFLQHATPPPPPTP